VVVKRTFSEKVLHFLDGGWIEKRPKKPPNKIPRGRSPQDGAFFHELDPNYRTFGGPAVDELIEMLKAPFKRRNRPDD
jgi:hypothetical protein